MNLDVFVQNFMNFLTKIFNGKNNNTTLDKDQIAKLLSTNREALGAFENSYHIKVLKLKLLRMNVLRLRQILREQTF